MYVTIAVLVVAMGLLMFCLSRAASKADVVVPPVADTSDLTKPEEIRANRGAGPVI